MAVLGDRATGVLDMLIDGLRRDGQNIATPNMSPLAPTQLERTLNRPETRLGAYGTMTTTTPMSGVTYQASQNPLIADLTRGRVLDSVDPMLQMPEPMPVAQAIQREEARRGMAPQQTADAMGMQKLAADADRAVRMGAAETNDPSVVKTVQDYFGGRENMLRLAMAFNTMRLQPDAGLASALSSELKDVRATRAARDQQNRTAAYFDSIDPKIAAAIRGGLSAKDAIALYRDKERGVVVGKMVINPTTGDVIYDGTEAGSELPATFRALQLRAEAAGLQKGTEAYSQFMINAGQRSGLSIKVNENGSFEITEGGTTSKAKALTEGQGKATQFAQRMSASQRIINTVENEGTSIFNAIVGNIPFAGNLLTSPDYKLYEQAKRDFVNAVLRYESGAAIGASEFESADRQYFPQPGDTAEVIAQKRRNRDLAIATMQAVSGPQAEEYSKNIRVQLFGPEAANWPAVGTVEEGMMYKGGDPAIESNWEAVR